MVVAIAKKVASLDREELMMQQYKDSVKLLLVDNKIKGIAEYDEDLERPETSSGDENLMAAIEIDKKIEMLSHRAVATLLMVLQKIPLSLYTGAWRRRGAQQSAPSLLLAHTHAWISKQARFCASWYLDLQP